MPDKRRGAGDRCVVAAVTDLLPEKLDREKLENSGFGASQEDEGSDETAEVTERQIAFILRQAAEARRSARCATRRGSTR